MRHAAVLLLIVSVPTLVLAAQSPSRPNFLLITADDLHAGSVGVMGCRLPAVTPNIDRLASQGLRFAHAHVAAAICQPCRQALMTGRVPHRNSLGGFDPIRPDVPTLQEQLHQAGYVNGILGKVPHLAPQPRFAWDTVVTAEELGGGRNPKRYYEHTRTFLAAAKTAGKPFFLMANSADPHRPFPQLPGDAPAAAPNRPANVKPLAAKPKPANAVADGQPAAKAAKRAAKKAARAQMQQAAPPPTKYYTPDQIEVPGFLPDLPDVRRELAQYYTAVHRCDETVGEILRALADEGLADSTLVMFLGDNGMAFPFAKTNCYRASTQTAWIARWPSKIKPGTCDDQNLISGVDFLPTVLEAAGLPAVAGIDGRSLLPLLAGGTQPNREFAFTEINANSAGQAFPMRAVQDRRFGYIFNAWADGTIVFRNESQAGLTWKAMQAAATSDAKIAARVRMFQYRAAEEFYDYQTDPCALKNLVDDPRYRDQLARLRQAMLAQMRKTEDPQLEAFQRLLAR